MKTHRFGQYALLAILVLSQVGIANAAILKDCLTEFSDSVNAAVTEREANLDTCSVAVDPTANNYCIRETNLVYERDLTNAVNRYETCSGG